MDSFSVAFPWETENMIGNSRVKLTRKNLDMVAANNVKMAGAGFQGGHQCSDSDYTG